MVRERARRETMIAAAVLLLVLGCLAPIGRAEAAPPGRQPFNSPQLVLKWINGYRARPEPGKLPQVVQAMSALGLFRDLEAGGVYVGFMAGVLGDNPKTAEKLVALMFPMPPEDQVAIVRAIVYSGLTDWKELLAKFAERMPARKVLIDRHLAGKLPGLDKLPLDTSPAALDTHWGFYFATGRFSVVGRIVETLAWTKDGNNVERLTLGHMAKWTLANNALQDKELLDHLKAELRQRPKPVKDQLAEVIEAAETFETAKIRKEATGAIEDLKRKGPESVRKFGFWSTAGQTVLALGCVAAGALGHAEIAVPCVIGGAATSAGLKIFGPQP